MKTTLLFIALFFSVTYLFSQTTSIPDPIFEQALIDQSIDSNGLNGNILNSDASVVQDLSVSGLGISNLSGIEAFNSLLSLSCDYNSLTTLDLSANTTLTSLNCSNNGLTSLNLGTNNLEYLFCYSNLLTGLDLSTQMALVQLDCSQNLLAGLNIKNGNNTGMQYFNTIDNPNLYCIDVDDPNYCNNNWTNIDSQAYFSLDCNNTQTTYIPDNNFEQALINLGHDDVLDDYVLTGRIDYITTLGVNSLGISDLTGIEDFSSLVNLNCSSNSLTSLDLSSNTALEKLYCSNNSLTSLNVANDTALTDLNCYNNKISTLDFSSNTALEILNCNKNLLTSLNVTNNSALTDLSCGENYVTLISIDVSQNLNLKNLNIQSNNWMSSLDVTNNTALEYIVANGAPITNLDLTQNTALLGLECQYCNLSTLDVSQNLALVGINVGYNYLVDLDFSNNINLSYIVTIYNNSLVSLNVKNGNNYNTSINATNANSLDCITVDDVAYSTANWSTSVDVGVIFSTNCALGIEEFNKDMVTVYPNPAKDKFYIDLKMGASYSMVNLFGQEIRKGSFVSGTNELDIQSLSNGFYLLNMQTADGKATKKLIKE